MQRIKSDCDGEFKPISVKRECPYNDVFKAGDRKDEVASYE